jgi:hypothetical protein
MKKGSSVIWIIIGLVVGAIITVAVMRSLPQRATVAPAPSPSPTPPAAAAPPATPTGFSDAVALLPDQTNVLRVEKLRDTSPTAGNLFWIERFIQEDGTGATSETWITDVTTRTAHKIRSENFLAAGTSAEGSGSSGFYTITHHFGWEGPERVTQDFIDVNSGALLGATSWEGGQSIKITNTAGVTATVALKTDKPCVYRLNAQPTRVNATALTINGVDKKFTSAHALTCTQSEMSGEAYLPDLGHPYYGNDTIGIDLPWNHVVTISLKDFSADSVSFR